MENKKIEEILKELSNVFDNIESKLDLENIKVLYMGKNGKISALNSLIKDVPAESRKEFGMKINELISKIMEENIPTMINDETGELNPSGRQALKELVNKYQDIKSINKIAEIQSGVDSLKVDMKKNITKMVESVDNVNELQNKSEQLKLETEDYKKTSVEIRKLTWWQNCKLWVIIIGIVLLIVLIIVLIVVL